MNIVDSAPSRGYAGSVKRLALLLVIMACTAFAWGQGSASGGTISGLGTITPGDCVSWASPSQIQDTGSGCGSGGGVSPGTAGQLAFYNSSGSTVQGDPNVTDLLGILLYGGTSVNAAEFITTGSSAGQIALAQGTAQGAVAHAFAWMAPTSIPTGYVWNVPSADCSGYVTVTADAVTCTATSGLANVVYKNATNTFTSAGTLDMSGSTSVNGLQVPNLSSCSGLNGGALCYNSTLNTYQGLFGGVVAQFLSTTGSLGANTIMKTTAASGSAPVQQTLSTIVDAGAGVTIGSPTGGAQGAGTLNATNLFIQGSAAVAVGQTNVYGAFLQDFTAGTMEIPEAAGFTAGVNSTIGLDTTANIVHVLTNGSDSDVVVTTATDTTTKDVLHATAVAGVYASSAIAASDLPTLLGCPYGGTTAGSSAAQTITVPNIPAAATDGTCISLQAGFASSAATTLTVTPTGGSAYAAISVAKKLTTAAETTSLSTVDMVAGGKYSLIYDSTNNVWVLQGTSGAVNTAGSLTSGGVLSGNSNNQIQGTSAFVFTAATGVVTKIGNLTAVGGTGVVPTRAIITLTGQTAAITTATLCTAAICGNGAAGQYNIDAYVDSTVTCATPGPAVVGITLTWTDETGTKSAQSLPLDVNGATSLTATMALGNTTNFASGHTSIWTTGTIIQYATTYTGCTSGSGTYAIRMAVTNVQ
jgi:hypothetical protein